jgi:hypothetical protein
MLRNLIFLQIIVFLVVQHSNAQTSSGEQLRYSIKNKTEKSFTLVGFSKKEFKYVFKSEIKFPEINGEIVKYEEFIRFKDKNLLFTSLYDKKNKIYYAYVNEISPDGKLNPTYTIVDEIQNSTKDNKGYFTFSISSDTTNILAFRAHDEIVKGEKHGKIFYKTLDENLKSTATIEIEMPTSFDYCSALHRKLIDGQNLFYIEKSYLKEVEKNEMSIKHFACLYSAKEKKLYKAEIMPEEKYLLDINVQITSSGQLFCSGIYGIDKNFNGSWDGIRCLKGAFYTIFDKNDLSIISQNNKNIQEALANNELYRFHLTNSVINYEKVEITCQFQHKILESGVGEDAIYKEIYGQYITTSFNLKNKSDILISVKDK